jgi:murein DD-endopeptidase MepM/ murein hydrolase activator NlpD
MLGRAAWGVWIGCLWAGIGCGGDGPETVAVAPRNRPNDAEAAVAAPEPRDAGRRTDAGSSTDAGPARDEHGLSWPIDCTLGSTCEIDAYPDIDGDGKAFDCSATYRNKQNTGIGITPEQQAQGVEVRAAAAGQVLWAFDGKYDQCPNADEPDCAAPVVENAPGVSSGYRVCTPQGPFCGDGKGADSCCCFWCFDGGNVIVIRHLETPGVFATVYQGLKRGSILVAPGDRVERGQPIAQVGSAGDVGKPHLGFGVWGTGFHDLADPWAGECGPNVDASLWRTPPPTM